MQYRVLGKTGFEISEIGFGSWGIGKGMWKGADDGESLLTLKAAVDAGINFIDTALVYGDNLNHHSEKLIGQFLKTLPSDKKVYVASKIYPMNRQWPALPEVSIEQVFPLAPQTSHKAAESCVVAPGHTTESALMAFTFGAVPITKIFTLSFATHPLAEVTVNV